MLAQREKKFPSFVTFLAPSIFQTFDNCYRERERERQTDRQADRQTDRQTETDRQTDNIQEKRPSKTRTSK